MSKIKVAGVQMNVDFADAAANLKRMSAALETTTTEGAWLTVFPECTTTGYCFDSLEEAKTVAEPIDGRTMAEVVQLCGKFETRIIYGFLESVGEKIFNSLALVDSTGVLGTYRKVHLPFLGVDRFTTPGDCFDVVSLPQIRIGMNICYDSSFPEAARVLALKGADLICLPTNWPPTSGRTSEFIPNARALENHVYFMAINRIGTERGFQFIGNSKICDPGGAELASAMHDGEAILYAEIDPELARQKHRVAIPGAHEVHRMNDRHPIAYGSITDPKTIAEPKTSTGN